MLFTDVLVNIRNQHCNVLWTSYNQIIRTSRYYKQ